MSVATGIDEVGNNLNSNTRMKEIENVIVTSVNEEFRLRALLMGLGTITKSQQGLGNFFIFLVFCFVDLFLLIEDILAGKSLSQRNLKVYNTCKKFIKKKGLFLNSNFKDIYKKLVQNKLKKIDAPLDR
jgi:hypothetical protein